ncbi:TIGR04372 family glycosyltransferase [Alphaproteobacteria bacterium]|nr:TIGR04372 family glycosyltransferase [Alphaproteobacteria bacterium]
MTLKNNIKRIVNDYLKMDVIRKNPIEVEINKYTRIKDPYLRHKFALKLQEKYPDDHRSYLILLNIEHYLGDKNQFETFETFRDVRNKFLKNNNLDLLNIDFLPRNTISGAFGNFYTLETLLNARKANIIDNRKFLILNDINENITNNNLLNYFESEIILINDVNIYKALQILELPIGVCQSYRDYSLYLDLAANLIEKEANEKNFSLKVSSKDLEVGSKYLKKCGLKKDDWFVTLHVRENSITDSKIYDEGFRNSNPNNYMSAVKHIIKNGGFVFRMGDNNSTKLESGLTGFIDYAHSEDKTPQLDVFLGAKSKFCIGTSSGYFRVPRYFDVPVLLTNQPQTIEYFSLKRKDMFLPKKILKKSENKEIKFIESFKFPYSFFSSLYRFNKDKYKTTQNTDEEIYLCTRKMVDHVFSFKNKNNFPKYLDNNISGKDLTYGKYKAVPFAEIPDDIIDRFG